ncbi:MAG: hypothetical protein PF483_13050 [Halothiobacillus sp.]|jgi:hypothetical protein|nr:hypothetical protein [Halothiobacillus sp.]
MENLLHGGDESVCVAIGYFFASPVTRKSFDPHWGHFLADSHMNKMDLFIRLSSRN